MNLMRKKRGKSYEHTHPMLLRPRLRDDLDILQTRSLGDLVMYPRGGALVRGHVSDVDEEVPDLAVETGRVDVPLHVQAVGAIAQPRVLVGAQHTEARECA